MGDRTAFFYGTLISPKVLYRVCFGDQNAEKNPLHQFRISMLNIQPAILHEYSRRRVKDCPYPAIIHQKGHTVQGTYVTGLTDGDIGRLDLFEGEGYLYKREKVNVELVVEGGNKREDEEVVMADCETYIWMKGLDRLEEKEWDFEDFRKKNLKAFLDDNSEWDGKCRCRYCTVQ
ncbi:hypothetical protein BGZ60DRAFT_422126 [Tricladium varicosporioides]|nr:hypothetical protein BGZ60DRAFT_422126 [Hymenoscyphus varicosporioides]